tara:strand:- start:527 stop:1456 length:930 start_codon:yes stop_codon:yes gene_type:complete
VNLIKSISRQSSSTVDQSKSLDWRAYYELTKPRLSLLSVFTAALGFLVHDPLRPDISLFICLSLGTALAAGGAAALNQWMERKEDALMPRTSSRPLPAKLLSPQAAFCFGMFLSSLGLIILGLGTNFWAMGFTFATLLIYLLFYTPLKKRSAWAIEVGAIAGALPPLIGWVAAAGSPSAYGWILFGILFTWQLPHFMAIAWNFRDDYNKGGFKLHHLGDDTGYLLSRKSLLYTFFLTALVFSPFFVESSQKVPGMFYLVSASILSLYLLLPAVSFFSSKNRDKSARKLFFVTIIYLPLLLATLVIDRYL